MLIYPSLICEKCGGKVTATYSLRANLFILLELYTILRLISCPCFFPDNQVRDNH